MVVYKKIKDLKPGNLVCEFIIDPYRGSINLDILEVQRFVIKENFAIVRISNMVDAGRNILVPLNNLDKSTIYTSLFVDLNEVIDLYKEKSAELRMHIRNVFGPANYVVKSYYMTHLKVINSIRRGKKDFFKVKLW